jgi:voltage-gated potassium channel
VERAGRAVRSSSAILPEAPVVQGDATVDHYLEQAGIRRARAMVASLSADADNLFACLSARYLNEGLFIVARAHEEQAMEKMFRAGADRVVSPNVSSAIQMASFIVRPTVMSLMDVATHASEISLRFEQTGIPTGSSLAGQTLEDAAIPQRTGLIVIALEKEVDGDREFLFNPVATTRLEPGDELIVLGDPEQVDSLRRYVRD